MGCVVNGPGEMQEADFGLVGAPPNRVDVYEARTRHTANVPCEEALNLLEKLIRKSGKWREG
jgi:(E)-4-hydroxy-3-methylbut-2-enyl-diphosphate synthase